MKNKENQIELYSLVFETLNEILIPLFDTEESYQRILQTQIEDLEGDYYSFLNENNIRFLLDNGLITLSSYEIISKIKLEIDNIPSNLWNTNDFLNNEIWNKIRTQVIILFQINSN